MSTATTALPAAGDTVTVRFADPDGFLEQMTDGTNGRVEFVCENPSEHSHPIQVALPGYGLVWLRLAEVTLVPSPKTVAPVASRNRRRFLDQRPATLAAAETIPAAPAGRENAETSSEPPAAQPAPRRRRVRTRRALHSPGYLDAYAEYVLGNGPRPTAA